MFTRLFRFLFRYWSLERKSLLFIGLALLISICISFWVIQLVANDLVKDNTRQLAKDYANMTIAWAHAETGIRRETTTQQIDPPTLAVLRRYLLDNPLFKTRLVMLSPEPEYDWLDDAYEPSSPDERKMLESLLQKTKGERGNTTLSAAAAGTSPAAVAGTPAGTSPPAAQGNSPNTPPATAEPQPAGTTVFGGYSRNLPDQFNSFEEEGPVFEPDAPEGGYYVYYHPISFPDRCMDCHHPKDEAQASAEEPFCVMKVLMPYQDGQVWSAKVLAVMIAVGMVTLSVSILILHLILRKLVIQPLRHLRNVSDEISRGKYDLRASIDTDDEFSELAEAFNRMLRHLTESQEKLQELNSQLDGKVDELARANLYLYEANRLKSDFMANMSHELRTPLNSIIGFSDVLYDISSLTDKQKRYASNIQKSGRMLLEMINDILDLAKVEAGKMKVGATTFDLGNVAQAQCDMLRSLVEEKNMELRVIVSPDLTPIYQDQPKIQQILTNLLSNAIKFTPDGGLITLTIGCVGDDLFHMTVADTGVGIPESDFEVIFEKFRQSNSIVQGRGLTREYSGTGLGLSIVKELCKLLGGEIKLSSQLGTGSTFHVLLPRHYTPEAVEEPAIDMAATI